MQTNRTSNVDAERIGVVIASILLTFAVTRLLRSPELVVRLSLPGFYFQYALGVQTLLALLAAGLAAAGMDWLLHGNPALEGRPAVEHAVLPALTTLVMGVPLGLLPAGPAWWTGFGVVAMLLAGVILAEYVVVDPAAPAYPVARAGLTALSYALFLILVIALRVADLRMVMLIPPIFFAATVISLRILHLDGYERWDFPWALGIGLVCTQIGAGLRYWPLSPLQFGLALIGPLYALTTLSSNLTDNAPLRRAAVGPGISLAIAWASAALLR